MNGLILARVYGVPVEMNMELEQVYAEGVKDSTPRMEGSSTTRSNGSRHGKVAFGGGGVETDFRGKGQSYVPPPFRGAR